MKPQQAAEYDVNRIARRIALVVVLLQAAITPVHAQQMIDEWLVRTTALPDAMISGAAAVFRNPALIEPTRKAEALLLDVRGPEVTGLSGMAAVGSYRLDGRTAVAAGYQHLAVDGMDLTEDSPDPIGRSTAGQNLFAVAASHIVSDRLQVGAAAQYLRLDEVFSQQSAVRLGLGALYLVPTAVPVHLSVAVQNESRSTLWSAAARVAPKLPRLPEWNLYATYGVAGGGDRLGMTHRVAVDGLWRDMVSLQLGAALEPESGGHEITPIGGLAVRINRYEIGVVRESLASGFGAVHTFRMGVLF